MVLHFALLTLGGILMLSAWHASTDIAAVTAPSQRSLKIFAAHSPSDVIALFPMVKEMCTYLKDAVGAANFNGGEDIVVMEDNSPPGHHAPYVPSVQARVGAFLGR